MAKRELKPKSPLKFENAPTKDYKLNADKTISKKTKSRSSSRNNPTAPTLENAARLAPQSINERMAPAVPADAPVDDRSGFRKAADAVVGGTKDVFNALTQPVGGFERDENGVMIDPATGNQVMGGAPLAGVTGTNAGMSIRALMAGGSTRVSNTVVNSVAGMKAGTASKTITSGAAGLTPNAATPNKVSSFVGQIFSELGKPKYLVGAVATAVTLSLGGKAFGDYFIGVEETHQNAAFVKSQAYQYAKSSGDWSIYEEAVANERAVFEDNTLWEEIKSFIPYANVVQGVDKYRDTALRTLDIWEKLAENKQNGSESESSNEYWSRVNEDKAAEERAMIDYYNEQRQQQVIWEQEARAAQREEEARFWESERKKAEKAEEEARKRQADFWLNYKKLSAKLDADRSPSKLGFGLL